MALVRTVVKDGVTGLFYVRKGCQFKNAVLFSHSRQNCHFCYMW